MNAKEYLKKFSSRSKRGTISIYEMWHMRLIDLCKYMEDYHQQRISEITEVEEKIEDAVENELIGQLPIHKGPFLSQAEARRCAAHDNERRVDLAQRITEAILSKLKGE